MLQTTVTIVWGIMAKTSAERVQEWRERLNMKASFYETLDAQRRRALDFGLCQNLSNDTPEFRQVRTFITAYPYAVNVPVFVGRDALTGYEVGYGSAEPRDLEVALVAVALAEITSAPIAVTGFGPDGGWLKDGRANEHFSFVQQEVADMRRLGIWRA